MTKEELIERTLIYIRGQGPAVNHRKQEYQEREYFSRVQVRSQDEGGHLERDWTGSSFGGRVFGGGRWGGGRER
jgi:hypothetical protein